MSQKIVLNFQTRMKIFSTKKQTMLQVMNSATRVLMLLNYFRFMVYDIQRLTKELSLDNVIGLALTTIFTFYHLMAIFPALHTKLDYYIAKLTTARILEGPVGWAILAIAGISVGVGVGLYAAQSTRKRQDQARREQQRLRSLAESWV